MTAWFFRSPALKDTTTHVVVAFKAFENFDNEKSVDLVPKNWIRFDPDYGWQSFFPEEDEYDLLDEYVKSNKEHHAHWEQYPIEILKGAKSYESGKRRMERSYADSSIVHGSSDSGVDGSHRDLETVETMDDSAVEE